MEQTCEAERPAPQNLDSISSVPARALVLAPHPDDFDAIAVTLKHFHCGGCQLHLAVLTSGVSGVRDDYPGACEGPLKARIREREQRNSCALFGLPEEHLRFLRLEEDEAGHQRLNAQNLLLVRELVEQLRPEMLFMPHGHDSNVAHQRTWKMVRQLAQARRWPVTVMLNRDAKTLAMRTDALTPFNQESAHWKARLLRAHDSQQQRNLVTRGIGFDERVLEVNRVTARSAGLAATFAEAFEVRTFAGAW